MPRLAGAPVPFVQLPAFVHGDDAHFVHAIREALHHADRTDILSAFVQTSGVRLLIDDLRDSLARGAHVRFLTGDYLGVTSSDALRMLLTLSGEHAGFAPFFYETTANTAFHPKSYIFLRGARGVAYVGSSNLSASALQQGVEWNLRLVSSADEPTFAAVRARFEHLLASPCTKKLTREIIDAYEARAPIPLPPRPEARGPEPKPNEIQVEALDALKKTRRDGHRRGLVVLATGLGKTSLSAFDFKNMGGEHRDRLIRGRSLNATEAPIVLSVTHANSRPILRFDRSRRADIPTGLTPVLVEGERYAFDFKKIAVNVGTRDGGSENVLATLMRSWFGPTAGLPGTRHHVRLVTIEDTWHLQRPEGASVPDVDSVSQFPQVPFYADVQAACGAIEGITSRGDPVREIGIKTGRTIDAATHFVVRASGDSMNGGPHPIDDGDLVLCEWARGVRTDEIEGHPFLLVGKGSAETSFAVIKVPRRSGGRWMLESWNPTTSPQPVPTGVKLEPVARVLEVVEEPGGLVLWGEYNRDSIAEAFGSTNNPSWKVGHRDIDVDGKPQTIMMVTLRKAGQTKVEHRYADQFLTRDSLQWESQASTKVDSAKGRRIIGHAAEGRTIHLFVQYDAHSPFSYVGPLRYAAHEGETPMRVRFDLEQPLPDTLWRLWAPK